jgi:hypothetical protein
MWHASSHALAALGSELALLFMALLFMCMHTALARPRGWPCTAVIFL